MNLLRLTALGLLSAIPTDMLHAGDVKWKGQNGEYTSGSNWLKGEVPKTGEGDTALIPSGDVTYTPGGDLTMANGGRLQISGGSWTQVSDPAYIRLSGKGSILIDGGIFNQGTSSSVPFAVEGTDNVFSITSGTANITSSFNVPAGLTYSQTGGTVNVGGEFDFNTTTVSMSGGILNTTLITGVNVQDQGKAVFNFSGGVINLSSETGIYGGGPTQYVNFTPDSTGVINFNHASVTETKVEEWVANSVIQIDNAPAKTSEFRVSRLPNGGVSVKLSHPKAPAVPPVGNPGQNPAAGK